MPIPNVLDETVHQERGDSVEKAATTATSLEAMQNSSNIAKTQSTAIPTDPISQETSSDGGPRRQETMRVPLFKLVNKLEKTVKTSQARRRAKIVVLDDDMALEDSSKQGRMIEEIDQNAGITLVTLIKVSGGVSTASRIVSTAGMIQQVNIIIPSSSATKDKERAAMKRYQDYKNNFDEEESQRLPRCRSTSMATRRFGSQKEQKRLKYIKQLEFLRRYLINQRKRIFMATQQKAEANKNKPMSQAHKEHGSSKNYKIFSEMLDDFDRQDVVDLYREKEDRAMLEERRTLLQKILWEELTSYLGLQEKAREEDGILMNPIQVLTEILKKFGIIDSKQQAQTPRNPKSHCSKIHMVKRLDEHLYRSNETVTKEREDIMERAATTASSLERRVDSGNINRTQSMATLNDPKSFGKHGVSLVRQQKLTAQAKEIPSLKKIVKKLERKRKSKTLGMNLFNIGTSKRRSLGEEDASKRTSEELETGKQRRCKAVTTYNADSVKDEERKTKIRDVKQEPSKIARKTNSTTSPTFDLKTKTTILVKAKLKEEESWQSKEKNANIAAWECSQL
ncbi:hypothetical protein Tco_0726004 [Tanacetum coccineum]|uniref:Uncharacterized protein n=1 Tax=Tanacetum coccineum TaxID=301880 RepID=A0ABQ4YEF9_9ASTR